MIVENPADVAEWLNELEVAAAIIDFANDPDRALAELSADYLSRNPDRFEGADFADVDAAFEEQTTWRRIVAGFGSLAAKAPSQWGGRPHFVDVDELARRYRTAGLEPVILPGARTRAARMYRGVGFRYGVWISDKHHTAQGLSWTDMQSIEYLTFHAPYPVMANVFPSKEVPGRIYILAAGASYTAGQHPTHGQLPASKGNERGWSWECPNTGLGNEPWPDHLQETILIGSAVEANYFAETEGWETDFAAWRIPAHYELTTRKIDPLGICRWTFNQPIKWIMPIFRADVRNHARELRTPISLPPPSYPEDRIMTPTIGPKTLSPQRLRDTRDRDLTGDNRGSPITGLQRFAGYHADHDVAAIDMTITALAIDKRGRVSCNGTTILMLDPGSRLMNTVTVPLDENGQFEFTIHGTKCHLVIDRVAHYPLAS